MLRNRLRIVRKPKSDKQYTPLTWIEALSMCGQYIRVHMHIACVECHIHINQTYTHIASIDTCVTSHTITEAWGDESAQQNLFRASIRNATVETCIAPLRDNACVHTSHIQLYSHHSDTTSVVCGIHTPDARSPSTNCGSSRISNST